MECHPFYLFSVTRALEKAMEIAKIQVNNEGIIIQNPLNRRRRLLSLPVLTQQPKPAPRRHRAKSVVPEKLWCVCSGPDNHELMIKCDSKSCHVRWFHVACLGLSNENITAKWFCPFCK